MPASPVTGANNIPLNIQQGWPEGLTIGLTKREAFAMAAMQGLLSGINYEATEMDNIDFTELAVMLADSLLEELEEE